MAVIDSGTGRHPDLAANMFLNPGESGGGKGTNGIDDDGSGLVDDWRGWDFVNDDNNPQDDRGHGTQVSGTLAARTNNALGIAGVAGFPRASIWPGPKIVPIKVLNAQGSGTDADVADGLVYAGRIGAKVANVSLGRPGISYTIDDAILASPNTLFAIAAGNDGLDDDDPASYITPCVPGTLPDAPNKLCVAATTSSDTLAGFSNYGATHVDLAAPGVNIVSTAMTRESPFSETFETDIAGRWTTDDAGQAGSQRWNRSTVFSTSPAHSITDSPGDGTTATDYGADQDNWARTTTGIDLTNMTGCAVAASASIAVEQNYDFFRIEVSRTPTDHASWHAIYTFTGTGSGAIESNTIPAAFEGRPGLFVRLRLTSDEIEQDDGAYVDDLRIRCHRVSPDPARYEFTEGTSLAAPHVAGVAAFLATRYPTANVAQLRNRIIRSVDRKAALTGKVATGGRLNMYKAAAESTAGVSGGVLRWTAPAGQKNSVTVSRFTDGGGVAQYRLTDTYSTSAVTQQSGSRIIPGTGCARIHDTVVNCPVAGITRIALEGNDHDDRLDASTIAIPVNLYGGAGDDTLVGGSAGDRLLGGTGADGFTGNPGNDAILARDDAVDTTFDCGEHAGDTDRVTADVEDVIAASDTNCEVVDKG